jgi:hypothetical protein
MAKVNIIIDTEEGILDVSINGVKVTDVDSVSAYRCRDSYKSSKKEEVDVIILSVKKDENDVKTITQICASQSPTGRDSIKNGTVYSSYADFVVKNSNLSMDVKNSEEEKVVDSISKAFAGMFGGRSNAN